jgi:phage terminase large subunit
MSVDLSAPTANRLKLFGGSKEQWWAQDKEVLMTGPAGTGKSVSIIAKYHSMCLVKPGCRILFVRKNRESMNESVLFTYEEIVLKMLPIGAPVGVNEIQRRNRDKYVYPNGSEIIVRGMKHNGADNKAAVMSNEYDAIYVQEAIELTEKDWQDLTTRLRNYKTPYQQITGDTNPSSPTHWLYRRYQARRIRWIETDHRDNPRYYDHDRNDWTPAGKDYVLGTLANLIGLERERLYKGLWVQAEGVVYPGWDPRIHMIDKFEIPGSWRRIRSIDFGFVNPFVCLWAAVDHDNVLYIYRQLYRTHQTVKVHAKRIIDLDRGDSIAYTVSDHDAEDRATLAENGIGTVNARKMIRRGIDHVTERLKLRGDGKPGLRVLRDSLLEPDPQLLEKGHPICLEDEMGAYIWPPGRDTKNDNEVPLDLHNHAEDSLRYLVMSIDYQKAPVVPATQEENILQIKEQEEWRERKQIEHLMTYGWNSA